MGSSIKHAAQQKNSVLEFVERWQAMPCNEEEQSRSFWIEFLGILGINNPTHVLDFERKVKGRKIDVFYEDMGILVEQKGGGVSLDESTVRSQRAGLETPYQQAKWYADNLPHSIRPRWIITCNFYEFRIYDLDRPEEPYTEVLLKNLPEQIYLFSFFTDKSSSRLVKEQELSVKAGEIVGKLYKAFAEQYQDIENNEREQHSLNVLIVRLVFLLYAEDAGLLQEHLAFGKYLGSFETPHMRKALIDLFEVLNTPENKRDPYIDPALDAFPYINGGLFEDEDIVIPQFTETMRVDLLVNASKTFDWKDISPTIFGAVFESTLNPETRRSGGMHYTSIQNIHKVIDPLFLDRLRSDLEEIEGEKTERKRIQMLRIFQKKLSEYTFLDPAAGSHNFLTETYLSLRKLELRVIEDIQGDQTSMLENPIMVNLQQLYAIEINDFAVAVGKTALWIAEQQMMEKTQELLPYQAFDFLPLKSITNSHCANALRIDWDDVLPAEKCTYIIGNPPFRGARWQSAAQKEEIASAFAGAKNIGNIDYVAGWYMKAADYTQGHDIRCAFVSTNSICQGEQVANIWYPLYQRGIHIDFAHDTFRWANEVNDQAHVYVVIVGFSREAIKKRLFHHARPDEEAVVLYPAKINAYLADAPDVFIWNRSSPLCEVSNIGIGSQPIDNGNYLFTQEEKDAFLKEEPAAERFFHPWLGAQEFINNKKRWVLWLGEATSDDLLALPKCRERIDAVQKYRASSKRPQTKKAAKRPNHFGTEIIETAPSVLIPEVSSERRRYIPMGFIEPDTFCSNKVRLMPNATLYHFGILHSLSHNAWMRVVCGRLENRYNYSNGIVYNNFPWPQITKEKINTPVAEAVTADIRKRVENCAQGVLDARAIFPDASLADLYDPDKMPAELLDAHEKLDAAVEKAYGVDFHGDEEKIVSHLFKLYADLSEDES